jgi:hypothetical protein
MNAHGSTTVAEIISAAGGKIVGRTRLMKMFYLLAAAGIETSFSFELRPYGPYSEDLIHAEAIARMEGAIREDEFPAGWGGKFVVFTSQTTKCRTLTSPAQELLRLALEAGPVELELATTALYLAQEGVRDPWFETGRRSPDKANLLPGAKTLLMELHRLELPQEIPALT